MELLKIKARHLKELHYLLREFLKELQAMEKMKDCLWELASALDYIELKLEMRHGPLVGDDFELWLECDLKAAIATITTELQTLTQTDRRREVDCYAKDSIRRWKMAAILNRARRLHANKDS